MEGGKVRWTGWEDKLFFEERGVLGNSGYCFKFGN